MRVRLREMQISYKGASTPWDLQSCQFNAADLLIEDMYALDRAEILVSPTSTRVQPKILNRISPGFVFP